MLKAWFAAYRGAEWGCVVVAETPGQAKSLFHRDNPMGSYDCGDYIDVRLRRLDVEIPEDITEPTLCDGCEPWNCEAWSYDVEYGTCEECSRGAEKRQEWEANRGEEVGE